MVESGIESVDYHYGRINRVDLRYRLRRRTTEVLKAVRGYMGDRERIRLLDAGTADGLMIHKMMRELDVQVRVGIDLSLDLLKVADKTSASFVNTDVQELPLKDSSFDLVVSTAVLEHLPHPEKAVKEAFRVLDEGGVYVVSSPNPFLDRLASRVGYIDKEKHPSLMSLERMAALLESGGFQILESMRFMISPVGLPFEDIVEGIIRNLGLGFLMCNQLVVGKKR